MSDLTFAIAFSAHLLPGEYNAVHPSIQYQADNGIIAGAYYNSEYALSAYAGYRFEHDNLWLEIGGVTGYDAAGPIAPMLRAGVDLNDRFTLFVAPAAQIKTDGDITGGLVIGVETKLFSF